MFFKDFFFKRIFLSLKLAVFLFSFLFLNPSFAQTILGPNNTSNVMGSCTTQGCTSGSYFRVNAGSYTYFKSGTSEISAFQKGRLYTIEFQYTSQSSSPLTNFYLKDSSGFLQVVSGSFGTTASTITAPHSYNTGETWPTYRVQFIVSSSNPSSTVTSPSLTVENRGLDSLFIASAILTSQILSPPTISSVTPASGPVAGGTSVTITGTNFTGVTAVTFGGTAATSYTVNSATSITAVTPAGSAGAKDVVVTTAGGTATSANAFTYVALPTITSVSPSTGVTGGGTSVTITGTNLTGATAVTFGGTAATSYTVNSATSITAVTPAGSAGAKDVVVTTAGGTATSANAFTYTSSTATLSSLALSSGTLSPTFASGTTAYTASVANSVTSITVTPTVTQANATVTVNGTAVTSGSPSGSIALNIGSNTITTVVTAQDGTTTQTYTTTVTRAALLAQATLIVSASPTTLNTVTTTSSLSTSGGSGSGAVSYSMTSGTCTLSGSTVTAGTVSETCTVTATKASDGTYAAATATVNITVARRATIAAAATDSSVIRTQASQLVQSRAFIETQIQNIATHLDGLRTSFTLRPSSIGVRLITPSMPQMAPVFYKLKEVASGNSAEHTKEDFQKVGVRDANDTLRSNKLQDDYNNLDELKKQIANDELSREYDRGQQTYSFWSTGSIDTGLFKTGDNRDVNNKFRVNSVTFGLDYKAGEKSIVGIAAGFGHGNNNTQELGVTVKSTNMSLAGYGLFGFGNNWIADAMLGYSSHSFSGDRTTSDGAAQLGMNRGGEGIFGSISLSKVWGSGSYKVAPFVRQDFSRVQLDQYTESGPVDYALAYDRTSYKFGKSSVGLLLLNDIYLDTGKLTLSANISQNLMRTGSSSQDVFYADTGAAGGIYTLQQNSSYQSSQSLRLGLSYRNKVGDAFDLGWQGAIGRNNYRLNGLRISLRFAL